MHANVTRTTAVHVHWSSAKAPQIHQRTAREVTWSCVVWTRTCARGSICTCNNTSAITTARGFRIRPVFVGAGHARSCCRQAAGAAVPLCVPRPPVGIAESPHQRGNQERPHDEGVVQHCHHQIKAKLVERRDGCKFNAHRRVRRGVPSDAHVTAGEARTTVRSARRRVQPALNVHASTSPEKAMAMMIPAAVMMYPVRHNPRAMASLVS